MTYDDAFDLLIGNEGGYVDNPKDPGGETNWGITWPVLHQAKEHGVVSASATIKDLTRDQAKEIYKVFFWDAGKMNQYDGNLAFQVFDFAVNSSIPVAVMHLQKAAGVTVDGIIGPESLAAINKQHPSMLIMKFIAERLDFWTYCKGWPDFGAGWARRAATDLRIAVKNMEGE